MADLLPLSTAEFVCRPLSNHTRTESGLSQKCAKAKKKKRKKSRRKSVRVPSDKEGDGAGRAASRGETPQDGARATPRSLVPRARHVRRRRRCPSVSHSRCTRAHGDDNSSLEELS